MGKRSRRRSDEERRGGAGAGVVPSAGPVPERILSKVRALLAKAESTEFDAEAEAFTAKAQELMARYALSDAMVRDRETPSGVPGSLDVVLSPPYVGAKGYLLLAVASANRCRVVRITHPPKAVVFGFTPDLDAVELLYTSLLVQATRAVLALGSVTDGSGRSRTRSFRRSFLLGFASRISERLREAVETAADDVAAETGLALVPVLADRSALIDEAVRKAFPHLSPDRTRVSNGNGFVQGRAAGDRAAVGGRPLARPPRSGLAPVGTTP